MSGLQVICVDDDPEIVDLTAAYLQEELPDAAVTTATSAAEGLDVLDDRRVHCVVSDYEMPGRSGLEFLRAVRDRDHDLPFILFTGKGSEEIASEAISAGVTDYIQKRGAEGFELLANRVGNAVTQWRAERDLQQVRDKMAQLHETALRLREATEPDAVYELGTTAADEVLAFDTCGLFTVEDGKFVPTAMLNFPADFDRLSADEGLVGETLSRGESILVNDVASSDIAVPRRESFRSCVSVPVGDHGVFQAISTEVGFFDENDVELAELLVSHVAGALDRIEYERDLERTNEQLEAVLANTTAHVYIKDLDGRYTLVNEQFAEQVGVDREEIIGHNDREIQDPEIAEEVRANDKRAVEEGESIEVEESAEWDGERRVYYSVKSPVFDGESDPKGVCGVSSDITELKAREQELQRKTERLDEFASVVSHDLRNPLTVAKGYHELIEESGDADEEALEELETSLSRMEEIIDELLALARGGRNISDTESVEVATVAERAWATVDTAEATLRLDTDRIVEADPSRLQQLLENLFRNSAEHGSASSRPDAADGRESSRDSRARQNAWRSADAVEHAGPDVTVRVEDTDDGFAVADDGPGLPQATADALLADGATPTDCETGLGLAIVARIAEAHDWELTVSDDAPGARIEFTPNR